jgi:hypothetical protein
MSPLLATRARLLAAKAPRLLVLVAGFWALVLCSARAMGGLDRLWTFEAYDRIRFTSMAMLDGTLKLRNGVLLVDRDEQVFNGATYTNWGFGAPLLQMPFHAVARWVLRLPWRFFPDRTIYFVYLMLLTLVLWMAFDRVLASHRRLEAARWTRHALSWSAVLLVLSRALFPLMAGQFLMYQETICYMVLCELLAVSAYVFATPSWSVGPVVVLGAAAGMGLLARPTTVVYVGMWAALVLLEGRTRKSLAAFVAGLAPFLGFWLYSNEVRSGGPLSFGYSNSITSWDYNLAVQRFGNPCTETLGHTLRSAGRLFRGMFITATDPPAPQSSPTPWYARCHDTWELRPGDGQSYHLDAFLGPVVLALLVWILASHLARRERRLSIYVPFAALAAIFFAFAREVLGFSWRYVGDFWPAIVLICVQYVRSLPPRGNRALGVPLATVFTVASFAINTREIEPAQTNTDYFDPRDRATEPLAMWGRYVGSQDEKDPPLPTAYKCGEAARPPVDNGLGWLSGCGVLTMTNLFLHVPEKHGDDRYHLHFDTEGMAAPSLRVYVNGRYVEAHKNGDAYTADVPIRYDALNSPTVMVTIEWVHGVDPPPGKLLRVELGV